MSAPLLTALQDQLGSRYTIERELGRGGMGAVYLARDRQLDRLVALKVLPPDVATDARLRDRFLRETRLVAGFSHPHIVPVFAVEETQGVLAFAMGFIEGESLTARVKRAGPLTSLEAVRLLQDIGYALAYAHGRGIVHRDLKPDNIMIERATGRALLMDFGIARAIGAPAEQQGLTLVGEVVGTPEFMSPEQACGDAVDGRSDLYSLALVAYFALTGVLAIRGDSTSRLLVAQLTQPVPSVGLARPDLPSPLVSVIDRCAAKDPTARYATAEALVDALDAAHLSAPEVAVPIRELGSELDAIPVVLAIGLVVSFLLLELNSALGWSVMDGLTSITVVIAIVIARLAQVRGVRLRLARLGFDGAAVHAGLRQLYEERAAYRAVLRMQPGFARKQLLMLAAGIAMIPLGSILGAIARAGRTQLGPSSWYVPRWGEVLFFANSALYGVGLVLIARTALGAVLDWGAPRFWLGSLGRWLLGTREAFGAEPMPVTTRPNLISPQWSAGVAAPAERQSPTVPALSAPELDALRAAVQTIEAHLRSVESQHQSGGQQRGS